MKTWLVLWRPKYSLATEGSPESHNADWQSATPMALPWQMPSLSREEWLPRSLAASITFFKTLTNSDQTQVTIYLVLRGCMLLLCPTGKPDHHPTLMLPASANSQDQIIILWQVTFLSQSFSTSSSCMLKGVIQKGKTNNTN